MQEKYVARAIILNDNDELLITKRASGYLGGKWEVPGGLIERKKRETPRNAAIRETREEVNLIFDAKALFKRDRHQPQESIFMWNIWYFSGSATGDMHHDPSEVADAAWVSQEKLDQYDFTYPRVRNIMHEFYQSRSSQLEIVTFIPQRKNNFAVPAWSQST